MKVERFPRSRNYGKIAEERVDAVLRDLYREGIIDFWFRASHTLDDQGVDHIFGINGSPCSVWVLQVTSGKKKIRTYYQRVDGEAMVYIKRPYRRKRYYRYIPLLAVTAKIPDEKIRKKVKRIRFAYRSVFKSSRCPQRLKDTLIAFLLDRGVAVVV